MNLLAREGRSRAASKSRSWARVRAPTSGTRRGCFANTQASRDSLDLIAFAKTHRRVPSPFAPCFGSFHDFSLCWRLRRGGGKSITCVRKFPAAVPVPTSLHAVDQNAQLRSAVTQKDRGVSLSFKRLHIIFRDGRQGTGLRGTSGELAPSREA